MCMASLTRASMKKMNTRLLMATTKNPLMTAATKKMAKIELKRRKKK